MKKLTAILLALVLLLSLAGCTDVSGEIKEPEEVISAAIEQVEEAIEEEPTESPEEAVQEPVHSAEETIEEAVLVDEAGVKITAKSLDTNGLFGPEVKLLIENTSGKNLTVQCRNSSINGYMVDNMMSVDVADGKKANDSLTFMSSELELCGIETIADMEFSFYVFDSSDWTDYLETDMIQILTSAADSYTYEFDDSGDLVYEGSGVKVVVKGLSEDSILGPGIVVYLENNSDQNVTVQTRNVSINGFMVDAMFSSDVMIGKHTVDSITFLSSELEENEITEIETVELSFHIFCTENWNTIVETESITIEF